MHKLYCIPVDTLVLISEYDKEETEWVRTNINWYVYEEYIIDDPDLCFSVLVLLPSDDQYEGFYCSKLDMFLIK